MAEFEKESFKFPHEAEEAKGKPLEAEEEVEYIVEDDTPPEDRNREPLPAEVIKRLEDSDEEHENLDPKAQIARIKAYKKAWNDERRIKDDAMREQKAAFDLAKQVIEENKQLKEQYNAGEKTYIETVQNAADTTLAMAKREYKEALESGDSDRIVESQTALSEATYKLQQAKQFRPSALQNEKTEVQLQQLQQQPKTDPKTQAWLDENPWYGAKKAMSSFAVGIHEELVDEYGTKVVGSDQYFKHIDKTMRKKFPEYFDTMEESSQAEPDQESQTTPKAKPSTVVAPATRSTSSKQVRLKQSQMTLIKKLGLTPEVYAREQQKLEASNG